MITAKEARELMKNRKSPAESEYDLNKELLKVFMKQLNFSIECECDSGGDYVARAFKFRNSEFIDNFIEYCSTEIRPMEELGYTVEIIEVDDSDKDKSVVVYIRW